MLNYEMQKAQARKKCGTVLAFAKLRRSKVGCETTERSSRTPLKITSCE
jgi:hypothetical protein